MYELCGCLQLTSTDFTKLMLCRIREIQPQLNAASEVFEEDALREAAAVDSYLCSVDRNSAEFRALAQSKPLLGIPFSMKNSFEVTGGLVL